MKTKKTLLLFLLAIALYSTCFAQGGEVEIMVRKTPTLGILPEAAFIYHRQRNIFTVTGLRPGTTLRASLSCGTVEVIDTTLSVFTDIPLSTDTSQPPPVVKLRIKTFGKDKEVLSSFEKDLTVIRRAAFNLKGAALIPPFAGTSRIQFRGFRVVTWRLRTGNAASVRQLSLANERMMRNNIGSSFSYMDASTGNYFLTYRAVDLKVMVDGREETYHCPGGNVSMKMSETLRKLRGRCDFTLLLHKRYRRSDPAKTDIIDTVKYEAPRSDALSFLRRK